MYKTKRIRQLNENCILEIIKHVKRNCETCEDQKRFDITNYTDLINFTLACEWFRDVLWKWDSSFYNRLEIDQTYITKSSEVIVNFDKLFERMQNLTPNDKNRFWKMFIKAIKANNMLEQLSIIYLSHTSYDDYKNIFSRLIQAIHSKPILKSLHFFIRGSSLNCVRNFPKVEHLILKTIIVNAAELGDYCSENPKLICLEINSEIYGKLSDFLSYCNQLKTLRLKLKRDFTDSEYTTIAKLPKLSELSIQGEHRINALIMALRRTEPKALNKLIVDQPSINIAEISELLKIQFLEYLQINGAAGVSLIFKSISFDQKSADVIIYFQKHIDASDLAALTDVVNFSSLLLVGNHKIGTLKPIFKAISLQKSPILKRVSTKSTVYFERGNNDDDNDIHSQMSVGNITNFNNDEMIELLKIKSLEFIDCQIYDPRAIQFPTQLPQLEELSMRTYGGGSLVNLLRALALQENSKLNTLNIENHPLDFEEISVITKLLTLTELKCGFADMKYIDLVSQLKYLELFEINSQHQLKDISECILQLFISYNGNLSICYPDCISINKNMRTLSIQMNEILYSEDLEPLARIPNIPYLLIHGRHAIGAVTALLKAFAANQSTVLQEICIEMDPIFNYDVVQISKIKTLKYIECEFMDPRSIKLLASLPILEELRIKSVQNFHEVADGVLSVLLGCGNQVCVIRDFREITYNKNLHKLMISNTSYEDRVYDAREYALLAVLPDLHILHIQGEHTLGSFKDLFQALASANHSSLQEILMMRSNISVTFSKPIINLEETKEIAKLSTLRKLKCGFSDANDIEELALLTGLEEFVITTYKQGTLIPFFQALALQKSSNLQSLVIEESPLTPEETAEIAKVKTLKKLQCGFAEKNIELLAQMNNLEELWITSLQRDILSKLMKVLASEGPENLHLLNIINTPLAYDDVKALVGIRTLRSLHCAFLESRNFELLAAELPDLRQLDLQLINHQSNDESIHCLAQLNNLTDLKIESPAVGSLTGLFKKMSLRSVQVLQSLNITDNDVCTGEILGIIKINSLRRLKCGLVKEQDFQYLSHLVNLEVLEITSYHDYNDICQGLLRTFEECCKLKAIDFHYGTRFISLEFVIEVLKTLKAVRNPKEQAPIELRVPYFGGLTPEQIALEPEPYLKISKFENES